MKIGLGISEASVEQLRFARQMGADGVFCSAQKMPTYAESGYACPDELAELSSTVASYGLEILALHLPPRRTAGILSGAPSRDREIEQISATLRAAGQVGIPTVFFNLTPWRSLPTPWAQMTGIPTRGQDDSRVGSGPGRYYRPVGRGGAVLLTHDSLRAAEDATTVPEEVIAPYGPISAAELWARVRYFYEAIVPVAEGAGVNIGAHPDDPPEPHYRGVEQILNSVAGLQQLVDLVPSPRSGLLLCIGTLHEMGENTMAAIEYFLRRSKVLCAHFRNPRGNVPLGYYQEDLLDEGDLDMLEVMRLFRRYDYRGSFDPDHAVGIIGDERKGRLGFAWELGYMKALRAAAEADHARELRAQRARRRSAR